MPVHIERVKTYIQNFDDYIQGGIPKGQVVMVAGAPGTMKSSVTYSILYHNAVYNNIRSVYMTLEQSKANLMEQMTLMGMDDPKAHEYVQIVDLGLIRRSLTELSAKGSWMQVFKMYAENLKNTVGFDLLVLDSLDVLEMAAQIRDDRRTELFYLFEWLRGLGGVTSFMISEITPEQMFGAKYDEGYLADGIIALKQQEIGEADVQRRIRAVKLRSTNHKAGYFSLLYSDGMFRATNVISQ